MKIGHKNITTRLRLFVAHSLGRLKASFLSTLAHFAVIKTCVYIFAAAVFCLNIVPSYAALEQDKTGSSMSTKRGFDLISIAEALLAQNIDKVEIDPKTQQIQEFSTATQKFSQGNITVAYEGYLNIIVNLKSDFARMNIAKSLYDMGFFSLADLAVSKVERKDLLQLQIDILKQAYGLSAQLTKEEEIYLAKAYSSIYFDNSAQEISFELNKKTNLLEKSDYANYILSQSMFELRQYPQALNYIDIAISKNPKNSSYALYKTKILVISQDYKNALKHIEKHEKTISQNFKKELLIYREQAFANLPKENKKYHTAYSHYLDGNYSKVVKDLQNLDKKAYMEHALLAKAHLMLGNYEEAVKNFEWSYKINKSYAPALSGLGDAEFISGRYAQSIEHYKKAYSEDKTDVGNALKLVLAYEAIGDEKNSKKFINIANKLDRNPFFEEYEIAATLLTETNKGQYLKKSLNNNMFFEDCWYEVIEMALENDRVKGAHNILYIMSFSNKLSYRRFYTAALVYDALGERDKAITNLKYTLNMNPDFEEARKLMAKLSNNGEDI